MTTKGNPKIMIKFLKTVELRGTSETRKTAKVRPYAIPTVITDYDCFANLCNVLNCRFINSVTLIFSLGLVMNILGGVIYTYIKHREKDKHLGSSSRKSLENGHDILNKRNSR